MSASCPQWRARMRAAKLKRKKAWRSERNTAPDYPVLVESKAHLVETYKAMKEVGGQHPLIYSCSGVYA